MEIMENRPNTEQSSTFSSSSCSVSKMPSLKRKRPPMIKIPNVLQEIRADKLKLREITPRNDTVSFSEVGVSVFSTKGKKKFMEDAHRIQTISKRGFFGVYDGHGGRKAAEFVSENLHVNISEMMRDCKVNKEKEEAVKAAYLKTDKDFLQQGVVSGACCLTVMIQDQEMIVSNLGDCRAVLCRAGVAEALTDDHRAERDDERKRIETTGGFVEFHKGAWRVHGILSVSRSIGDAHLKNWVVGEPETRVLGLEQDMEFLMLASDGLWEHVSNQEAVDAALRVLAQSKQGCPRDVTKENDENLSAVCVKTSPSSKLRRVSLVRPRKDPIQDRENESPPLKSRRISLFKKMKTKSDSGNEEHTGCCYKESSSAAFADACKELADMAVSRGSFDDITVMIVDLNHFKNSS